MRRLPTFLLIGAARSGTTALHQYLRQHPAVFMPVRKEPNFFAFEGQDLSFRGPAADWVNNSVTRFEDYLTLFAEGAAMPVRGEASPLYLYVEGSAARIKARLPDVKLIAILRDPAEQAYSHFLYAKRNMIEPLDDFVQALDLEGRRMADGWQPLFNYSRFPRYGEQLARFYAQFSPEQIQVVLYEDFEDQPLAVLKDIFGFIGADPGFTPDLSHRPNRGGRARHPLLQDLVMKPYLITRMLGATLPLELRHRIKDKFSAWNLSRDRLPADAKALLRERLRDDTLHLQQLIGRDLTAWLS